MNYNIVAPPEAFNTSTDSSCRGEDNLMGDIFRLFNEKKKNLDLKNKMGQGVVEMFKSFNTMRQTSIN